MRSVHVNGVDIVTEGFGDPAAPTVLLIGGAEASMDWWDEEFARRLAATGHHVIRFDTRDTGGSTTFPVGEPPYTQDDLLADVLGILDAHALPAAHIVGMSMGGGLAQRLAVLHPGRVLTLTLMCTSPGGPDGNGQTALPPMSEALERAFAEPATAPDWSDRQAVVDYFLAAERLFAGTIPLDEERLRRTAGRAFARSPVPAAAGNHWLIGGGGSVRDRLGEISAPTLVLHGTADPLFPFGHAEALAREIPGAVLVPLPGMGHQMPPPPTWDTVVSALAEHTARRPVGEA